jgi:hypothetical protein
MGARYGLVDDENLHGRETERRGWWGDIVANRSSLHLRGGIASGGDPAPYADDKERNAGR